MTPALALEMAAASPLASVLRAADVLYRARLNRCASCNGLREGVLCAWCGCFVQFRALSKANYCPSPSGDKWRE
ncbi:hypothetical protein FACS1894124_5730 [Spirochaetia bacterium]|nr:hypothetical protein FACS1894124_5730 [Spirochaetia bacterium]